MPYLGGPFQFKEGLGLVRLHVAAVLAALVLGRAVPIGFSISLPDLSNAFAAFSLSMRSSPNKKLSIDDVWATSFTVFCKQFDTMALRASESIWCISHKSRPVSLSSFTNGTFSLSPSSFRTKEKVLPTAAMLAPSCLCLVTNRESRCMAGAVNAALISSLICSSSQAGTLL